MKICSIEDCGNKSKARGLCIKHYDRFLTYGSTDLPDRRPCSKEGCGRQLNKNNQTSFCRQHYYLSENAKKRAAENSLPKMIVICHTPGCENHVHPNSKYGFCNHCGAEDRRIRMRAGMLLRNYNLTEEDYASLLESQNGLCAVCHDVLLGPFSEDKSRRPQIDHDHACCPGEMSCGKCVRGILHSHCNRKLAVIELEMDNIPNYVRYLEETSI